MAATQDNRNIAIETPLGKDALLLQHLRLREHLNRPFSLELELLSEDPKLDPLALPGQRVTVRIDKPLGGKRHINGFIKSFTKVAADAKMVTYRAKVVPWFALLEQWSDCRIFQGMTVPDILKQVFASAGYADYRIELESNHPIRGICTQYRETHFHFASRLMEQEGIAYHFEHAEDKHILVLTDASTGFKSAEGYEEIPLHRKTETHDPTEHIESWEIHAECLSQSVTLTDYDYTSPRTDLTQTAKTHMAAPGACGELFDAPGDYPNTEEGGFYASVRVQEMDCRRVQFRATALCAGVGAGNRFHLRGVPGWVDDVEALITELQLDIKAADYRVQESTELLEKIRCQFKAIPASTTFRPERVTHRPRIDGMQTAVVTGPVGNDAKIPYVTPMGSIKVQFRWDRYGKDNELSSGWIRTSQIHAGDGYGAMFIPRIGNEVLVSFENGDPDRPVIVGSLYNGGAMPTLPLPHFAQRSYIHDDGGNAICFAPEDGKQSIVMYSPSTDTMRVVGAADEAAYEHVPTQPQFP